MGGVVGNHGASQYGGTAMLQGFLIYLSLALGSSALVLVCRIIAMLRPPRTGDIASRNPEPKQAAATRQPRRQVAAGIARAARSH